MVFPTINNPKTTTFNQYGGDVLNLIQQMFSAVDVAAVDLTNKPTINTDFRFRSGRLILFDIDYSNTLKFITPQLTGDVNITFPATLLSTSNNEMVFTTAAQTLQGKTILATQNIITGLADTNIATGAAIAWSKISKTGSGLGDLANVNLTGLGHNYSIKWDSISSKWVVYDVVASLGEANTMTNLIGSAGSVGIFKQKTGVNFELKKLNSSHTSLTVTDDTSNNEIDIGVMDATTSVKGVVELATDGENAAGVAVQGNDARLSNPRTAIAHAASHMNLGSDVIKVNELGAPTANITTTNSTITANGTAPMLPNNAQLFWNGVGGWTEPVGTASGVSGNGSIIRGVATASGNGSTKVFTIAHGMTITPTSWFVDPLLVDALGFFTKAVDGTNITITYQVAPPTGTNNLKWSWVVMDAGNGSTLGEANTYSSVGTGVPITKTKVGIDLPFRSLFAGSTKMTITENTNDISFDVNQANLSIGWSQLTGIPLVFTPSTHASSHLTAGSDPIAAATTSAAGIVELATSSETTAGLAVQASDSRLTNARTPTVHAPIHTAGSSDPITLSNLAGTITDAQVSTNTLTTTNTKTVTSKTINLVDNILSNTGATAGGIPLYNGSKYLNLDKGADGTFLGVSGGSVGYFTPTGSSSGGGLLPDGTAIPSTGRWGYTQGGISVGRGIFNTFNLGTVTYEIISPTEAATTFTTAASDDAVAEMKTSAIWSRQSNPVFRAKWALKSTSGIVVMVGLSSQATLPTGGSHDDPLDGASGVLITCSHDIESNYQVSRNDGGTSQTKVATTVTANNTTVHTCEINLNTTNCTVTIDGVSYGPYTTEIPALTTALYAYVHIEAIGSTARGVALRYAQITCL